jgi:uncharacterized FlaG/YvyC family protein
MDVGQVKSQYSLVAGNKGDIKPPEPPKGTATEPLVRDYSIEEMQDLARAANASMPNSSIRFKIDEQGEPPIIVIIDPETDEIVRQIPPEEIQNIRDMVESLQNGESYITNFIDRYA